MTKDQVAELIEQIPDFLTPDEFLVALATKAAEVEREKVAKWMIQQGYATGHGDTTEGLLAELEWQVKEKEVRNETSS